MAMLHWVEFIKTLKSGRFWLSEKERSSNQPNKILGENVGSVTHMHIKTNQKRCLHILNDLFNTIYFIALKMFLFIL